MSSSSKIQADLSIANRKLQLKQECNKTKKNLLNIILIAVILKKNLDTNIINDI